MSSQNVAIGLICVTAVFGIGMYFMTRDPSIERAQNLEQDKVPMDLDWTHQVNEAEKSQAVIRQNLELLTSNISHLNLGPDRRPQPPPDPEALRRIANQLQQQQENQYRMVQRQAQYEIQKAKEDMFQQIANERRDYANVKRQIQQDFEQQKLREEEFRARMQDIERQHQEYEYQNRLRQQEIEGENFKKQLIHETERREETRKLQNDLDYLKRQLEWAERQNAKLENDRQQLIEKQKQREKITGHPGFNSSNHDDFDSPEGRVIPPPQPLQSKPKSITFNSTNQRQLDFILHPDDDAQQPAKVIHAVPGRDAPILSPKNQVYPGFVSQAIPLSKNELKAPPVNELFPSTFDTPAVRKLGQGGNMSSIPAIDRTNPFERLQSAAADEVREKAAKGLYRQFDEALD